MGAHCRGVASNVSVLLQVIKPSIATNQGASTGQVNTNKFTMPHIHNIILDFDGTIADTQSLIVKTLQDTMVAHNLPILPTQQCAKVIGLRLDECFATLFPTLSHDDALSCADSYRHIFDDNKFLIPVQPFPNVIPTIVHLHEHGHKLALASSRSRASLINYIDTFHIANCIDAIVAADDVKQAKPHPEMAIKALTLLNALPTDAIVVGDMPYDILMGKAAGTTTCAVTYGNATPDQLSMADHIIPDFQLLIPIVEQ